MTTATTASGSENWETYSDASEMEPERDLRDTYISRTQNTHHAPAATANPLSSSVYGGNGQKRPLSVVAAPGSMAPPPAKHHQNMGSHGFSHSQYARGDQQQERFRETSDENAHGAVRIEGSDAAWSTELEESY
jgi:hypothetical protein